MKKSEPIESIAVADTTAAPRQLTAVEEIIGGYIVLCDRLHLLGYTGIPSGQDAREFVNEIAENGAHGPEYVVPPAALAARMSFAIDQLLSRVGLRKVTR